MDRRKSLLNVSVSLIFKMITMVMALVVKRFLIKICGNEVNGLNALYLSVIGFLSVAELGVGSAITFCMYKPIVEGDNDQVSALYQLFRRCYLIIGGIILACGCALTPFIHLLVKDYAGVNVNMYVAFMLMVVSVVLTYLYSAKISLINAYKNNYVSTSITSGGIVLQYILQIVVLLTTHSFIGYLVCRIVAVLVQWGITELVSQSKYSHITSNKQSVSIENKATLVKSIKAMLMHKVGTLLVNTADNIIISICIGVVVLGVYSNYVTIMDAVLGILQMVFSSLTSVIGHLCVKNDKQTGRRYCEAFHVLNFVLAMIFFLGYYAVIDELIFILFGTELVTERSVAFVVGLNGFVQFMRRSTLMFKDATGMFYRDRWKPLLEGGVNIVLSIVLARQFGVTGVIIATIFTSLLLCYVVEPYILYKYAFSESPKAHYFRSYGFILLFLMGMGIFDCCAVKVGSVEMRLLINASISVGISALLCGFVLLLLKKTSVDALALLFRKKSVMRG